MIVETRFAHGPGGPVAYRQDGSGGRWLLVVPDRADPYGPPGATAYGAFVGALVARGWTVLTLLDGSSPGLTDAHEAGTDRRIAAVRSVARASGATSATVLGVAGGAPAAALAVAEEPELTERLILFASFDGEGAREAWALEPPARASRTPVVRKGAEDPEELARELRQARKSLEMARQLWRGWGSDAPREGSPGSGAEPAAGRLPAVPGLAGLIPRTGPLAGLGELIGRPERWEGGLDELLRQVTELEGGDERRSGDLLAHVGAPTTIIDTSVDGATGLDIAARMPAARHRAVAGGATVPWSAEGPDPALLAVLDEAPPRSVSGERPPSGATRVLATLLFTDIVASTERLAEIGDAAWAELLQRHHAVVRGALARFGGDEIDNAGDGFLASFSTPAPAIRCALAATGELAAIGLGIRCGLHTGECERIGDKLGGIAVHIGARIAGQANAGEVVVSATVRDLVAGSGIAFAGHGTTELKGLPGTWNLYRVVGAEGGPQGGDA